MMGFTDNYIKVRRPFDENLGNTLSKVKIGEVNADCVALGI